MKNNRYTKFMHSTLVTAWLILATSFASQAIADSLTLSTDRQTIEEGDIISLYVNADFQTLGKTLDYEALRQDFEVLSRQRSNFYEVINGQQNARTRWHLRLLPKKTGELMIPAIVLGEIKSEPYKLMVTKSKPQPAGGTPPYFLQIELNKKQVYLQQETLYTLRFYHQGKLISGNIRPPSFNNALVDNLKEENIYDKVIDGNYYTVYEWVYVFYPQASGEMEIQAPEFNGVVYLQGKQKAINESAKTLKLSVLPVPESFPEPNNWLPAKSVFLKQEWKNLPDKIRVGDSLTRVITLQVFGLKANQLPAISTPAGKDYKIYKQQPLTQEEKLNDGIISQLEIIQTIVPTEAGKLELPEQEIYWWNTGNNHLETLFLDSRTFEIQPGMQAPDFDRANEVQTNADSISSVTQVVNSGINVFWMWLSFVLGGLWLTTLGLWYRTHRKSKQDVKPQQETSQNSAPQSIDWCHLPAGKFYQALREHTQKHLQSSLSELAVNKEIKDLITRLEQHLYYQGEWSNTQQNELCQAIKALKPMVEKPTHSRTIKLQTLYKNAP